MRQTSVLFLTAVLIPAMVSLGQTLEPQTKDAINESVKPVQKGAQQAVDKLENLIYGQRAEFENQVQAELDRAQDLQQKLATGAPSGTKIDANSLSKKISERAGEVTEKLTSLKNATEDKYSNAYDETQKSTDKL